MPKILLNKSNIDLDYPICRPSLDLDFTQEVLDERITFSRGSIGTRVNRNRLIETVPANQPRFDYDPVTGECKGLLIEESRVNSWINSGQSNVTGWNYTANTITFDNTQTAPDGTTNTIKFTERAAFVGGMGFSQNVSVTSGTSYTFSVFAKQPDNSPLRYFSILFFNTGFTTYQIVTFDPKNGTVLYNSGGNTTFIQKYPNGWWRFGVTATATVTTTSQFAIRFTNSLSSSANPPYGFGGPYGNYTGDGSSFLYFYGPQVENGAFMTSFIPTTTSVTRSADNASMTGTNFSSWYNQSEGSIYSTFINNTSSNTDGSGSGRGVAAFSNGTTTERIRFGTTALGSSISVVYISSNITQSSLSTQNYTLGSKISISSSYKLNYFTLARNDFTSIQSSIKGSIPIISQLEIGRSTPGSGVLNGTISRLTYYPRALKPNQLQLLTQ